MISWTKWTLILALCQLTASMYIPQDIEILDGYDIDVPSQISPDDAYFETVSLRDQGVSRAIRNRRSPLYHILESAGLRSKFHIEKSLPVVMSNDGDEAAAIDAQEYMQNIAYTKLHPPRVDSEESVYRQKRSDESIEDSTESASSLPQPEKQIMEPDYYRKNSWTVQSSYNNDYNVKPVQEEEDAMAEASQNEGIKGRTPRVNFVTQKGGKDDKKERMNMPQMADLKSRYEKMEARYTDDYPSRSYDPYLRRYDRYDDQYNRYDPYYEDYYVNRRRYDPYDSYSPRMPSYPEAYYDYPDRRYDVPEPRDYRPLYSNDIYDHPPSYSSGGGYENRNNRRIIYYAHLPEVIRAPPSVDLTYRHGRDRYNSYGYGSRMMAAPYRAESNTGNREMNPFIKREKKDYRNLPPSLNKDSMVSRKSGRE